MTGADLIQALQQAGCHASTLILSAYDARSIAAHEFGHALGMAHTQSSNCPLPPNDATRPTMCSPYYVGTSYLRTLQFDDKSGVSAAYP
jgi:hypothetical protein